MRLRDVGDAWIAIEESLAGDATRLEEVPRRPQALWRRLFPWVAVPLLAVVAWAVRADRPALEKAVTRFDS